MTAEASLAGKAPRFVVLDSGCYFSSRESCEKVLGDDVLVLDTYRLTNYDLNPHACLVIDGFVDQQFLYEKRERIQQFLDRGKMLIFSGNLFLPWLPGASLFVPKPIHSHLDYVVSIQGSHPIFAGVDANDLTYNKGVSGFFARGHHPVPSRAEVLLTLPNGEPITYIDRHSTRGTLLVHSGNNLLGYNDPSNTTGLIGKQLKAWVEEEYRLIQARRETQ
ncbi:phosphate starvation-inducible protein PhoH [Paenibacillus lentus]|uniref:Phosphate starvation-inducible protein PhoH n=1 Tax=Paenibacillus lentus TaxID=1338368 RepID=A0A3S8RYJ9_9BACL|nr:phosphate starvation-inducible protein PhoH [Paenibacillus lentus]AZK48006.1 phosphate starvation-inducible protein PhoH [Paenibacillus lentus]